MLPNNPIAAHFTYATQCWKGKHFHHTERLWEAAAGQLWFMRSTWRGRIVVYHGVSMQAAILQATAEMRAAPRPLPSSDWMKVVSQWGVISHTSLWNRSLKLNGRICKILHFNCVFYHIGVISFTHLCFLLISPLISLCLPSHNPSHSSCTHWGCSL